MTNGKTSKEVEQLTLSGDFICYYPSLSEVNRKLGFHLANISKVCKGERKKAHGFKWRYSQDD
jgi:hypothetical protein